jgi:ParB-like chromosome segregation protein Spo0J
VRVRDRVKELRRVPASSLRPNPANWRTHSKKQQDALRGVLAEVGYADALLARECEDGSLMLIDGHLRAETTPDQEVPVLVLNVDEQEAKKLLATLDPLAAMAQQNSEALAALLESVHSDNEGLNEMLAEMARDCAPPAALDEVKTECSPELFQVLIECRSEDEQQNIFERLTAEGYRCRALTL